MKDYKLSIIIPTKNEGMCISKVIEDVEKISLKNFEILIVDKSNDNTKEKVEERIKKYQNIRLIEQTDSGKGNAMKLGVIKAKSEVVCFLDGDGTYPPSYIPKMFLCLKHCV